MPTYSYLEGSLLSAIADVKAKRLSQKQAAEKWGVPRTTLGDRLGGAVSMKEHFEGRTLLSKHQEDQLISWILQQEALGIRAEP